MATIYESGLWGEGSMRVKDLTEKLNGSTIQTIIKKGICPLNHPIPK